VQLTTGPLTVQFPPVVHGSWASGQPRLDIRLKGGQHPLRAGMVLQLRAVDVGPLQVRSTCTRPLAHCHVVLHPAQILSLALHDRCMCASSLQDALASAGDGIWQEAEQRRSNAHFEGREAVLQRFKPGVETVHLVRTTAMHCCSQPDRPDAALPPPITGR
jgi:hypothetical protein